MSTFPSGSKTGTDTQISSVITNGTRRQIIQFLHLQEASVSIDSIARRLSSPASDQAVETTPAERMEKRKTELHHIHLPKLAEKGLVTYDMSTGKVTATDHPLYHDLPTENNLSEIDGRTPLKATLENHVRREVLVAVASEPGPISLEELARTIASREANGESVYQSVPELTKKLHHIHLPKLEESGFLTYDLVEGTISSENSPEPKPQL